MTQSLKYILVIMYQTRRLNTCTKQNRLTWHRVHKGLIMVKPFSFGRRDPISWAAKLHFYHSIVDVLSQWFHWNVLFEEMLDIKYSLVEIIQMAFLTSPIHNSWLILNTFGIEIYHLDHDTCCHGSSQVTGAIDSSSASFWLKDPMAW